MNSQTPKKVLIHIHVPKCAGASINSVIRSFYETRAVKFVAAKAFRSKIQKLSKTPVGRDTGDLETAKELLSSWEAFLGASNAERDARYDAVFGHMLWGYHELFDRTSTYISVTRPVVSRIISFYNFVQSNSNHPQHRFFRQNLKSLNDLTPEFFESSPRLVSQWGNCFCRAYTGRKIESETDYEVAEKAIMTEIKAGRFVCGSMKHIETYARSLGLISDTMPRVNVTSKDQSEEFETACQDTLTQKTISQLKVINEFDLRLLDKISEYENRM